MENSAFVGVFTESYNFHCSHTFSRITFHGLISFSSSFYSMEILNEGLSLRSSTDVQNTSTAIHITYCAYKIFETSIFTPTYINYNY